MSADATRAAGSTGTGDRDGIEDQPSRLALAVMVVGWSVIAIGAYGAYGKVRHFAGVIPWFQLAKWTVLVALTHDFVVAPIVCLVGLVVNRLVPRPVQGPVAAALIVSASVTLMALPAVRGYGRQGGNVSILPGDYGRGLLIVLAWIWAVAIAAIILRVVRARRTGLDRAARTSGPRPSTPR